MTDSKTDLRKPQGKTAKTGKPFKGKPFDRNAGLKVGTKVEGGTFGKKLKNDVVVVNFKADGKPRSGVVHVSQMPSEVRKTRDEMFAAAEEGSPVPEGLVVVDVKAPSGEQRFTNVKLSGRKEPSKAPAKTAPATQANAGDGTATVDGSKTVGKGVRVVVMPDIHVPPVAHMKAVLAEHGVSVEPPLPSATTIIDNALARVGDKKKKKRRRRGKKGGGDPLVNAITDALIAIPYGTTVAPGREPLPTPVNPTKPADPLARASELMLEIRQPASSFGLSDLKRALAVRKVENDARASELLGSIESQLAAIEALAVEATRIRSGVDQHILDEKAMPLFKIRAQKKDLDAQSATLKQESARYAGLCGKIKRAGDQATDAMREQAETMKDAIDTKRAELKEAYAANKTADNDADFALLMACNGRIHEEVKVEYDHYLEVAGNLASNIAQREKLISDLGDTIVVFETRLSMLG